MDTVYTLENTLHVQKLQSEELENRVKEMSCKCIKPLQNLQPTILKGNPRENP